MKLANAAKEFCPPTTYFVQKAAEYDDKENGEVVA
jgi:hypothetical protein